MTWQIALHALTRVDPSLPLADRVRYFAGPRYLPAGDIVAAAADSRGGIWIRTAQGASHIALEPMTLAQKAARFERRIRQRHLRHGLVAPSRLVHPGDLATSEQWSSDNDGLWTAVYVVAELFRFDVTGSPQALAHVRQSLTALLFLERVTGQPGFPARSWVRAGEPRPGEGVWQSSADGRYIWKGDTSSDEIVGHAFAYALAWDLLPAHDRLRPQIRAVVARIAAHIVDHGYELTGPDGRPTTWGKWSARYFATPEGRADSPLNALELLSLLKTAAHVTAESRFDREYGKVARQLGYAALTTRELQLRQEINYSDEELALLSFVALLRYERDSELRATYRAALDQWWLNIVREKNPLWIAIRALAVPATPALRADGRWTLCRYPLDLIDWPVVNSDRAAMARDPLPGRFGELQAFDVLPPDEQPVMKWNANPFQLDGGDRGASEDDGAAFLLAYWMGRRQHLWL